MLKIKTLIIRLRYILSDWIRPPHKRIIEREYLMSKSIVNSRGIDQEMHKEEIHKIIERLLFEENAIYEIITIKNDLKDITTTTIYYIKKSYI